MPEIGLYYLYPGALFAHKHPHIVTTVLGSCVAVCIWDQFLNLGGINHFQLPLWNGQGLASPKYGNIAIKKLLEKMILMGSRKKNLKAKVFGGANVLSQSNDAITVGTKNILIAKEILSEEKISIISANLGGNLGRKLKFNTQTGVVMMKSIPNDTMNYTKKHMNELINYPNLSRRNNNV